MRINWERGELRIKIVYYGPPHAGKTTNLQQLQAMVPQKYRSNLLSLDTYGDRTLFFDMLQVNLGKIAGLTPRVSLYTVPGQPRYQRIREIVLRGSDGIVFVADSAPSRMKENLILWQEMLQYLKRLGLLTRPIIIQANKQDLPDALEPDYIREHLLYRGQSLFAIGAQAKRGIGVRETFTQIVQRVLTPEKQP